MNFSCVILDLNPEDEEEFYKLREDCSIFINNVPVWNIKEFEKELKEINWWEENISYPRETTFLTSKKDVIAYFGQFKHR